jgi:hypothetical protein
LTRKTKRLVKAVAHRVVSVQSALNVILSVTAHAVNAVNVLNVLNVGRVVMLKLLA